MGAFPSVVSNTMSSAGAVVLEGLGRMEPPATFPTGPRSVGAAGGLTLQAHASLPGQQVQVG